jgi:hypothetical protein
METDSFFLRTVEADSWDKLALELNKSQTLTLMTIPLKTVSVKQFMIKGIVEKNRAISN